MNPVPQPPSADDPRLLRAVQEYLAELEAGRHPDRRALEARYPELAGTLGSYLDAVDMVELASPWLKDPGAGRPTPAAPEPPPGEPLGDFRIVREVGRGGMGVVYEAEQLSLGRRVALKVLPFAAALDARQLQRFTNEARAAAHLHHPNIVPVYFVGSDRGVHFYAMQLIDGQNIASVVEEMRRLVPRAEAAPAADRATRRAPPVGGVPASPGAETRPGFGAMLSTRRTDRPAEFFRAVAGLVAQAAEGLDYAHGLGIIHRDVKPANLLVDGRGNVWITDFGLAQFHADGGLTRTGDLLGTLLYMSPEQAGGPRGMVDHRTDVYSLGATLYELLTLRPLFDGTDRQTLLRQILHDEPRAPRAIDRAIPTELETIVLKALEKVPADRYRTAREFADDLRRFLCYEPIRARRATAAQRARKWLRRHPSVSAAAAVLLVLLAAGSLLSAWLIRAEQERTRLALQQERQRYGLAKRATDEMIRIADVELAHDPQMYALRRRLLEVALDYYQEFIELHRDDPAARAELASTRDRVRRIIEDLAVMQGAGRVSLLNDPDIRDDLGLGPEQRVKAAELTQAVAEERQETFGGFHRLDSDERRKRLLDLARSNDDALASLLSERQLRRLQQIDLQCQGLTAFREPDVVAALKLTARQREQIRVIETEEMRPDRRDGPGRGPWPDPDDGRRGGPPPGLDDWDAGGPPHDPGDGHGPPPVSKTRHAEMLKNAFERIKSVLTPEQLQRWRELTGAPLKGGVPFRPSGSFGPR